MKAEHVIGLIRAHAKADREHFRSIALMIAADCASKKGHATADRIRKLVDSTPAHGLTPLPKGDSREDSVAVRLPEHRLADLVLSKEVAGGLGQILDEYRYADELAERGLKPATKVLFDGPPGTGKTAAAGALALELDVPFVVAKQHELVDSHLGDSEKSVARLFDFALLNRAVVLLDEFDSIGTTRSGFASAAEKTMNRVVTTLLEMLDRHAGPSLLVVATNLPDQIDPALVRRFDARVTFAEPTEAERLELIRRTLGEADGDYRGSHAVIVRDCLKEKKRRAMAEIKATNGGS